MINPPDQLLTFCFTCFYHISIHLSFFIQSINYLIFWIYFKVHCFLSTSTCISLTFQYLLFICSKMFIQWNTHILSVLWLNFNVSVIQTPFEIQNVTPQFRKFPCAPSNQFLFPLPKGSILIYPFFFFWLFYLSSNFV